MRPPPRWLFAVLMVGGLLASGVYLGMIHALGPTTGYIVRAAIYLAFGILMLWGALGRR